MSAVYNLKTIPSGWQVTKFDDDFNVESSYEMTQSDGVVRCGCPAGQRPTCRHRQMFPMLQLRADTAWFLDFDTRQWVDPTGAASEASSAGSCDGLTCDYAKIDGVVCAEDQCDQDAGLRPGPQGSLGSSPSFVEGSSKPDPVVVVSDSHPFRRRM